MIANSIAQGAGETFGVVLLGGFNVGKGGASVLAALIDELG